MEGNADGLSFKAGTRPLVEPGPIDSALKQSENWWIGQIIWVEGGARDPSVPTLFRAANVDTGEARWIKADEATRLVISKYFCEE